MDKKIMRKHYEATPKETLIDILIASRQKIENLKQRKEEKDKEIEHLNTELNRSNNIINELEKYINENYIYDEVGMKIFDASTLQDKLQELKGSDKEKQCTNY